MPNGQCKQFNKNVLRKPLVTLRITASPSPIFFRLHHRAIIEDRLPTAFGMNSERIINAIVSGSVQPTAASIGCFGPGLLYLSVVMFQANPAI